MQNLQLFSIGNALVDQEFLVSDDFLAEIGVQKGTMQLVDADMQQKIIAKLAEAEHKGQASGGSAANTTVAFSALGGQSFYACRVGDDELGQFYLNDLQQVQVKTTEKSISQGTTGRCVVLISPDGERTMCTYLGITAELSDAQVDMQALKSAQYLYIEGYLATSSTAQAAVTQARQIARDHGLKIALSLSDPAMVQYARDGLNVLLGDGVDVLFCNEQEALMYTQSDDLEQAVAALLQQAKQVFITLGAAGALYADASQQLRMPTIHVDVKDSNGAGDAFAGGVLYGLVNGFDIEKTMTLGNHLASHVVAQYGPRLSLQGYQDVSKAI
ncbi:MULTISPECIES: adenosine kinase [unclassified Acinetobacter]|uniref:adenosine kinase n=1 Tax=unclassified Acinetobacter TaxID=196816 RepID=UPI0035BAF225